MSKMFRTSPKQFRPSKLIRFGSLEGQGIRQIYLWNCLKGFQFWFKGFIKNANEVADTKSRKCIIILTIVLLATIPIKLICTEIQHGKNIFLLKQRCVSCHLFYFPFKSQDHLKIFGSELSTRVSIVPGLFQFSSPGTFGLLFSPPDHETTRPRDHKTTGPRTSCPGTSRDVPGLPGTSQDLFGRLFEKKICKKNI